MTRNRWGLKHSPRDAAGTVPRRLVRMVGTVFRGTPFVPSSVGRSDAETELRKRTEPTNETDYVEFSASQRVWSRDKQKRNNLSKQCIVRCADHSDSSINKSIDPKYSHHSQY